MEEKKITFEIVETNKIYIYNNGNKHDDPMDEEMYLELIKEPNTIKIPYWNFIKKEEWIDWNQKDWETNLKPRLHPKLQSALYDYQQETVYKMFQRKRGLVCLDMGCGKSIISLALVDLSRSTSAASLSASLSASLWVICPSYLKENWKHEIYKWFGESMKTVIVNKLDQVISNGINIISYTMAAKLMPLMPDKFNFQTIILDESHSIKSKDTKRYKALHKILQSCEYLYLLTGTPKPNRVKELFTQLNVLFPKTFTSYWVFTKRYCNGHTNRFKIYDDNGESMMDELQFLLSKCMIRKRREDVLDSLPDIIREKIRLEPKTKNKEMTKLMKQFQTLDDSKDNTFRAQSLISEMFRLTCQIKTEYVLEYLKNNCIMTEEKTILFCKHRSMLVAITDMLKTEKIQHIWVDGSVNTAVRMDRIQTFLTDPKCRFAVLSLGTCSTGLNLVPIKRMIFCELNWTAAELMQAECRINRIGCDKHLHYIYLICKHTLDELVLNKVLKKAKMDNKLIDAEKDYGDLKFEPVAKKQKV